MKKKSIVPRGKQVLVKPDDTKNESEFGIITPDNVEKEKPQFGEVLAVGNDPSLRDVKKGARVIFSNYAGQDVELDKDKYVLLHEEDILAFLE